MGLGIPPLKLKIMIESNPLRSPMLVGRLAVLITAREIREKPCMALATHPRNHGSRRAYIYMYSYIICVLHYTYIYIYIYTHYLKL